MIPIFQLGIHRREFVEKKTKFFDEQNLLCLSRSL